MGRQSRGRGTLSNLHCNRFVSCCLLVFVSTSTTSHCFLMSAASLREFYGQPFPFKLPPLSRCVPSELNRVGIPSYTLNSHASRLPPWSASAVIHDVPISPTERAVDATAGLSSLTSACQAGVHPQPPHFEGQPQTLGGATSPPSLTVAPGHGRGTRKRAYARVRLIPGDGRVKINKRDAAEYLQDNPWWIHNCVAPLMEVHLEKEFDIVAETHGGGLGGQSGAIMLAVAREISRQRPEVRAPLRRAGFLTVDARKVERKKFGLRKARKREQYSKR